MPDPLEGGRFERLLEIALTELTVEILEGFGYVTFSQAEFEAGTIPTVPSGKYEPVQVRMEAVDKGKVIEKNTMVCTVAGVRSDPLEIGSHLSTDRYESYVEIYGQDRSMCKQFRGDIVAGLRGTAPSIGRDRPVIEVYDLLAATPPLLTTAQILDVEADMKVVFDSPWEERVAQVSFIIEVEPWQ